MTVRDFFENLLKHSRLIAFIVALALVLSAAAISLMQKSTASVIIKYINSNAASGLTENGEPIRPYEIATSTVVKKALEQLGYANVDTERVRRNISIDPIVPTAEEEKYASWIENFSDYTHTEEEKEYPVYYEVSYTSAYGRDFAKNVLNAIIKQYRIFYAEKYTYGSDVTELSGEMVQQYDYYETVDLLRERINENINYLQTISDNSSNFRSVKNGYSVDDLRDEYNELKNGDLAVVDQMIMDSGASKDSGVLINSLNKKAADAEKEKQLNNQQAQTNKSLMEIYSEKNKQYLWDDDGEENNDSDSTEEGQVFNDIERDNAYMQNKSTYDQLMLDYVTYRTAGENQAIDKRVYEEDAKSFSGKTADGNTIKTIETMLSDICEKYNDIYTRTEAVLEDYNAFRASLSIETESDVTVRNTQNTVFIYGLCIIVALGIGVMFSTIIEISTAKKAARSEAVDAKPEPDSGEGE